MATVKVKQLSKLLNVTPRRIQQLANEGMPRKGKGAYDDRACLLWYVKYLQEALKVKAVPSGDGGYTPLKDVRHRSIQADADLKEILLAEKRQDLIAVQDVAKVFMDLVTMTKARILATPAQIATAVLGETSRVMIQAKIDQTLREALKHLADDGSLYSFKRAGSTKH